PGTVVVYFLLFRGLPTHGPAPKLKRKDFVVFDGKLKENRKVAESDLSKADWELLEYDRLSQTPNDASAIEFRLKTLRKHLFGMSEDAAAPQAGAITKQGN